MTDRASENRMCSELSKQWAKRSGVESVLINTVEELERLIRFWSEFLEGGGS
jgi:hypothetical protein